MASAFDTAWSILKEDPPPGTYDWQGIEFDTHCPKCKQGIYREQEDDLLFIREMGMCMECASVAAHYDNRDTLDESQRNFLNKAPQMQGSPPWRGGGSSLALGGDDEKCPSCNKPFTFSRKRTAWGVCAPCASDATEDEPQDWRVR